MARQKKTLLSANISREEAEDAFAEYAKVDAKMQQITAKMDVQITGIREKHSAMLADLQELKDTAFEKLQAFAENNRDEFGNKKSLEFAHGILGFRTGTPKLKTRKGFTWSIVTNLLKEFYPSYLRISEEPAKDRLLADRDEPETAQLYSKVGIYVDQDETFYVEPKKEEFSVV
jgi:phage host-nuclease inhibitor protein Gam